MEVTITLTEAEIIAILKDHFNRKGLEVFDWQIGNYSRDGKVISDLRMRSEGMNHLLPKEVQTK
ncbi:hypothetical protein 000TH008_249 [Bacillus phage 000TH008]|nr:hypothetical protein 000TH008_249 [Bacillus phage 000TH008]QQO40942.1 hypothetical protein 000TH009_249 [Bacillus phage 000TH009]QQO41466.1 hypothetical protein 015DV004_251 [Bacillus phage 015DV004]